MESENINFSSEEASNLSYPYHNALVISILISNCIIKWTLIDNGSSTKVIFTSTHILDSDRPQGHNPSKVQRRTQIDGRGDLSSRLHIRI